MTYSCAWCGDTGEEVLEVINGQNTCELCLDLAKEDADHAKEGAIEYFLDELATTRNREEWRELLQVEVRKL
jgi:hypothetical protein